jgi:hypothetical protein
MEVILLGCRRKTSHAMCMGLAFIKLLAVIGHFVPDARDADASSDLIDDLMARSAGFACCQNSSC